MYIICKYKRSVYLNSTTARKGNLQETKTQIFHIFLKNIQHSNL